MKDYYSPIEESNHHRRQEDAFRERAIPCEECGNLTEPEDIVSGRCCQDCCELCVECEGMFPPDDMAGGHLCSRCHSEHYGDDDDDDLGGHYIQTDIEPDLPVEPSNYEVRRGAEGFGIAVIRG